MKIVSWVEDESPGPMAEALSERNVPYRLDQGHEGWVFSVRLRDLIFAKSIATEIDSQIDGREHDVDPDYLGD